MAAKTGTYTLIASSTLGSATSTVTFSSIPATYTDLVAVIATTISIDNEQIQFRFNNDSLNNYSTTLVKGDGTTATSNRQAGTNVIVASTTFGLSTTNPGMAIVNIQDYANTTTYKTAVTRHSSADKGVTGTVGLWRSTSAINRVDFITSGGNFNTGGTFKLYGIEAGNL